MTPFRWTILLFGLLGALLLPGIAEATCVTNTTFLPDGRVVICTTCFLPGGFSTTTCS